MTDDPRKCLQERLARDEAELKSAITERRILTRGAIVFAFLAPLLWFVNFWLIFAGFGFAAALAIAAGYIGNINVQSARERADRTRAELLAL